MKKILKGFDRGVMTGMILIDLQKAFDTTDHDVLLQNYMLFVSQNGLSIGLSLISPTDLSRLI